MDTTQIAYVDNEGVTQVLIPGAHIRLGRFESEEWILGFGWYSWGGNRPVCGWYMFNTKNPSDIRPLQLPDLEDIYYVEARCYDDAQDDTNT